MGRRPACGTSCGANSCTLLSKPQMRTGMPACRRRGPACCGAPSGPRTSASSDICVWLPRCNPCLYRWLCLLLCCYCHFLLCLHWDTMWLILLGQQLVIKVVKLVKLVHWRSGASVIRENAVAQENMVYLACCLQVLLAFQGSGPVTANMCIISRYICNWWRSACAVLLQCTVVCVLLSAVCLAWP